jgi:hypothetical protein
MKKIKYTVLPLLVFFSFSCTSDTTPCEEEIIIENPIPDTTLVIGQEPFRRDVVEEPVVFRHSEQKQIIVQVTSEQHGVIASSGGKRNDTNGSVTVVEVVPRRVGETQIHVTAIGGDCSPELTNSFNVTVIDSVSSN